MASSKLNIFNALPQHASDSEEEDFHKTKSKKTIGQKDGGRTDDKSKNVKKVGGATGTVPVKQEKEEHGRAKEIRKPKGVTDQAHPQERHSGTGHSAYGVKPKKAGAGKGNWGKSGEEKVAEEGAVEEDTEEVQEEEKPEGITLQEYYSKQNLAQNQPKVNEAKAKITSEQLIKELGNSTLLKSRHSQQVDDRKAGKKKEFLDVNHHAGISTDHADLLGFRTGFVEKEYRPRGTEEAGATQQKRGPRTGGKQERERENAKEEETPAPQTETVEGEQQQQQQATEGTEKTEGKDTQNRRREGQGQGQGQRGGRGGYRGDYKGDRPRKNYDNKPQQAKINFEDESAFPKLG